MTRPYAEVIGDPIAHSKSPLIHNFWLQKIGIDAEYRATHVQADELEDYFAHRREDQDWRGCNVTIPHKVSVLQFVDDRDSDVQKVGASNCIVPKDGRLVAENTDTGGIDLSLPHGKRSVCIIGAGGAARAAIPSLDVMTVSDIRFLVRDPAKARKDFADLDHDFRFFSLDDSAEAMRGVEGVINASPMGMSGKPDMPQTILDALLVADRGAYVFDMVYSPLETELLKAAKASGRQAIDGLTMLIGQAGGAFLRFFGQWPDPDNRLDAQLRALLAA